MANPHLDIKIETRPWSRTSNIIAWLMANVERIEKPNKVQVTFDCAGRSVVAELKEREKVETH
jgi:hypothetical protein